MKIAVVHSFYHSDQQSGENLTVVAQVAALRRAGHDVLLISQDSDERSRRIDYPLQAAATVVTGIGPSPLAAVRQFRPDVTHVHNLFPNYGTRWLQQWHGPVVATVHNFRPLCAAGTLFRAGSVCTRCPDGSSLNGIRFGCYRESRVATLPLAWHTRRGAPTNALLQRADRVVLLSQRVADTYTRYGIDPERYDIVPNFASSEGSVDAANTNRRGWLFAGRLSPEKGILELLRAWPAGEALDVAGDGPLMDIATNVAGSGVRLLGSLDHQRVLDVLPDYEGLLLPSLWFEGACPLIAIEALRAGTPVIAYRGSSAADVVSQFGVGTTVPAPADNEDLQLALADIRAGLPELSRHAHHVYRQVFCEDAWVGAITETYRTAIRSRVNTPE